MKWTIKYLTKKHLLATLRQQPTHMRHIYALTFAGVVTVCIASAILYFDYGFWRERYTRTDVLGGTTLADTPLQTESPSEMMSSFFREASSKIKGMHASSSNFLDGKEEYKKE